MLVQRKGELVVAKPEGLSPQHALIYVMVTMSAVDGRMADRELRIIGQLVATLPVFRNFALDGLVPVAEACARLLESEEGLDNLLARVAAALSPPLKETAYALAVELAAVDSNPSQEELRLLELIRHALPIDRLIAAAIERGARARYHGL